MRRNEGRRVKVHRYHPGRRMIARLVAGAGAGLIGLVLYWGGVRAGLADAETLALERAELEVRLRARREELLGMEQQLQNLSTSIEVERSASSQVRTDLATAQQQVEQLRQEAELYRSLMDSKARSRGLTLQSFDIHPAESPGTYRYRLTLLQRAERHAELAGQLRISLAGTRAGRPVVFELKDVSPDGLETPIPFRFVYFQLFDGELRLPEGFVPVQVRIVAQVTKGRPQTLDVTRAWQFKEA